MTETADLDAVKRDIQIRHRRLEVDDRKLRTDALRAVSVQTRPLFTALQNECAMTGHKLKFAHYNWDHSYRWYACEWCGAAVGENEAECVSNG
jgi:hypothetical protein